MLWVFALSFVTRLPSPISSGPTFSLIFLLPVQLSKPLLPCISHTTVTFQPTFVLATLSIPTCLGSTSTPLRGSPCLLPLCVSPLVGWAQPGAPIQPHCSPATCCLSHTPGWTVLAPEDLHRSPGHLCSLGQFPMGSCWSGPGTNWVGS